MKNARLAHQEIGVYDAKTKLAELLRRVEAGESFTITNRGNPVADIIPSRTRNESKTKKTIKAMLASRVSPISDEYLAELKNVGRKWEMSDFVLDNSVSMRWLMPSLKPDDQKYADAVLDSISTAVAIVPTLWRLEVANVLLVSEKRNSIAPEASAVFLDQLQSLPITLDSQTTARVFGDTMTVARQSNLTSYDAAYLELALREELPLASLDSDLLKAAKKMGVERYLI